MWYGSQVRTYGRDKKNTENLSRKQQSCTKALTIIKINSIRNNCSSIKLLTIDNISHKMYEINMD